MRQNPFGLANIRKIFRCTHQIDESSFRRPQNNRKRDALPEQLIRYELIRPLDVILTKNLPTHILRAVIFGLFDHTFEGYNMTQSIFRFNLTFFVSLPFS